MQTMKKYIWPLLLYGCLLFLLVGYILYPMGNTLQQALVSEEGFTLSVFREYLANPNNIRVIQNTFAVGVGSVVCCGILGTALAIFMTSAGCPAGACCI